MSKNIDIMNIKGEKVGDYVIEDSCLEFEKGAQALHDSVIAFLAACRAGTASTKTVGETSGSGKKPFKQKGGGRARSGNTRNPTWRKGGVAFGPKPRDFSVKVNAKVRQLALKRAFSDKVGSNSIVIVDNFTLADCKTKGAVAVLKALNAASDKLVIGVREYDDENILKATSNLPLVNLMKASVVNPYWIVYADKLLFTKDALDDFMTRLSGKEA